MSDRGKIKPFYSRKNNGFGIFLSEYGGNYALQAGKRTDNGDFPEWVFTSKWSQSKGEFVPDMKKKPMSVYLGAKHEAIQALEYMLAALKGV